MVYEAQIEEDKVTRFLEEGKLACSRLIANDSSVKQANEDASCPPVWDGILCWTRAAAGQLATQPCPLEYVGLIPGNASKQCTANGRWYISNSGGPWTNYSQCIPEQYDHAIIYTSPVYNSSIDYTHLSFHISALKIISTSGYSLSLFSLLVAFAIFLSIRKLRCPRTVLHMHLFTSFILRASFVLLKEALFVDGIATKDIMVAIEESTYFHINSPYLWHCRLMTTLMRSFILANHSWMLMIALHLHNIIFMTMSTHFGSIRLYIVLGWGLPLIFMVSWTICRVIFENTFCWTMQDNILIRLLIDVPQCASVLMNFVMFIRVVRFLYFRLKSSRNETEVYKRWAKSVLVLVPLFGVHYVVGVLLQTTKMNLRVEFAWLYFDQFFAALNGFLVALLFCFFREDVRAEFSKTWNKYFINHGKS